MHMLEESLGCWATGTSAVRHSLLRKRAVPAYLLAGRVSRSLTGNDHDRHTYSDYSVRDTLRYRGAHVAWQSVPRATFTNVAFIAGARDVSLTSTECCFILSGALRLFCLTWSMPSPVCMAQGKSAGSRLPGGHLVHTPALRDDRHQTVSRCRLWNGSPKEMLPPLDQVESSGRVVGANLAMMLSLRNAWAYLDCHRSRSPRLRSRLLSSLAIR
jgi:hypothetical protein